MPANNHTSSRPSSSKAAEEHVASLRKQYHPMGETTIGTTLRPGQKGTRELLKSYGDQLVCVRYRYDKTRGKRYKTSFVPQGASDGT